METSSFNLSFFNERIAYNNFDDTRNHVVGYARLSFDEDGNGYCSIINQKDLLQSVYDNGFKSKDSTYTFLADDNVSGYKFDRPSLRILLKMIEDGQCNIILAKDLSRIGRHGALTQLFIEQCERIGVRVYAMDDYDSHKESDDLILGIKTWSNERYVKDASQKVRKVIKHKQENGTWLCAVPFGYYVDDYKNPIIKVDEKAADIVRRIYDMYINGNGVKIISIILTRENIQTPSMFEMEHALAKGKKWSKRVSSNWTASIVSTILRNDFYIGTLRTGKYSRRGINGNDVAKDESTHNVFENHHQAIVDKAVFEKVRDLWCKNAKEKYRHKGVEHIFHGIVECGDCGSKLFHHSSNKLSSRYTCSTYYRYGKNFCTSHTVKESVLIEIAVSYLKYIKENCADIINKIGSEISKTRTEKKNIELNNDKIEAEIASAQKELSVIEEQRIKQIIIHPEREETLNAIYDDLFQKTKDKIAALEKQKEELNTSEINVNKEIKNALTALEIIDDIIQHKDITRKDIVALFEKIIVYDNGRIVVKMKPCLEGIGQFKTVINDKTRNQPETSTSVESVNKVSNGDPFDTILIRYVAVLKGINAFSESIFRHK